VKEREERVPDSFLQPWVVIFRRGSISGRKQKTGNDSKLCCSMVVEKNQALLDLRLGIKVSK